ncbi:ABC transporter substrate-binding protein [Candidatus Izemoplasma sp. B36]|uniref:ABC transporter substrate-binding protein n=1 Tax=Candidatus Izemoplasma sp. B36 TaxID=3242468 RepID=UPI0035575878
MKKLVLLFSVLFALVALTGCGKGPMQLVWFSDGVEGTVMQGLLDQYEEETGVEIELVSVAYDSYEAKLATMISGGNAPALARVTEGHLTNYQDEVISLEGVYDTTKFANLFFNADGDVVSLPMDVTANGMFVNFDLLDAYEVDYPTGDDEVWTWDTFYTEMSKLDGDDVAAPGVIDHKGHRFMPLIYQAGVTVWDTPYTTTNLTSQAAVDATQRIMDYFEEGFFDIDGAYDTQNSASLFRGGQYGFHISGNWNVAGYQDLTFDWGVLPMPKDANRATILGGKSMAAFEGSGYEQEAKDFIAWMAQDAHHDAYCEGVPFLSPRYDAVIDFGDYEAQYSVFQDEISATASEYSEDWFNQILIVGMYPIINDWAQAVATNPDGKTALQLLQELETELIAAANAE